MKTSKEKQILVIGAGSSGQRFTSLLKRARYKPINYRYRTESIGQKYSTDFIGAIIASPTNTHAQYAKVLLNHKIPLLIEKPLTDSLTKAQQILNQACTINTIVMTGFNLRFLPVVDLINEDIQNKKLGRILFADIHVGQYLPFWRPEKDYRDTYSTHYNQGGGVALDLIHEIDLAFQWFGQLKLNHVVSEHRSRLETDAEDFVRLTFDQPFPIQITLDCLSHVPTRRYFIVGTKGTIHCDVYNRIFHFVSGDGASVRKTSSALFDIKSTYERELDVFLSLIKRKKTTPLTERWLGIDALEVALQARKHVQKA